MKYACIQAQRQLFSVALMCRVLGVSRSGFPAAQRRPASQRAHADQRLCVNIRAMYRRSRNTYGSPRIHAELQAQGVRCGRKRVERLMRTASLQAKQRRRWRCTTQSKHDHGVAPNQLARHFSVSEIGELDHVWAGDITYVPTREGWLYVAVLLALASRRVVGWAMEPTLAQSLTCTALRMALVQRAPRPGLLQHSDRGVQYAATDYQALLAARAIRPSMSRKGDCYDNAVVESFFATLEWELIERNDWHTRREARAAIFEYSEVWSQSAASPFDVRVCQSGCVRSATRCWNTRSVNRVSVELGDDHLPSYSPDLSPIEEAFSKLKTLLRRAAARTKAALLDAIADALAHITAADAHSFFMHCGYAFYTVPDL